MMSATWLRENARSIALLFAALVLAFGVQAAIAAPAAAPVAAAPATEAPVAATEAAPADAAAPAEASGYTPLGPEMIKGQPTAFENDPLASMTFQEQHNELGEYALQLYTEVKNVYIDLS